MQNDHHYCQWVKENLHRTSSIGIKFYSVSSWIISLILNQHSYSHLDMRCFRLNIGDISCFFSVYFIYIMYTLSLSCSKYSNWFITVNDIQSVYIVFTIQLIHSICSRYFQNQTKHFECIIRWLETPFW